MADGHYRQAAALLALVDDKDEEPLDRAELIAAAQVHATLHLAEKLDLLTKMASDRATIGY